MVIYRSRWININATHYDGSPSVIWWINFDCAKLRGIEDSLAGWHDSSTDYTSGIGLFKLDFKKK